MTIKTISRSNWNVQSDFVMVQEQNIAESCPTPEGQGKSLQGAEQKINYQVSIQHMNAIQTMQRTHELILLQLTG